jgi:hypothetical protein
MSLDRGCGQLAHVSAIQLRVTRQLFDGQRAIAQHRADVDAEVSFVAALAEDTATAMVDVAKAHLALDVSPQELAVRYRVEMPATNIDAARIDLTGPHGVAALAGTAVRTTADAAELARVIDDALASSEPDGASAARQLAVVLDEWWQRERDEGRALVEDAHARAEVRRHVAEIEVHELVREGLRERLAARSAPAADPQIVVGQPATCTDAPPVAPHELRSLLAAMADELQVAWPAASAPAEVVDRASLQRDVLIRLEPRAVAGGAGHVEDPWKAFWERRPGSGPVRRQRGRLRGRTGDEVQR